MTRAWPAERWAWPLALALLAVVVATSVHLSEERAFVELLERARPSWLAGAVLLQLVTYLAQGAVWSCVLRAGGHALSLTKACRLSVAKLFVDQVVPSAGISGTLVFARALERDGIPRRVVMSAVVVNTFSSNATYVGALLLALGLARSQLGLRGRLAALAALFGIVSLAVASLAASGRREGAVGRALAHVPVLKRVGGLLAQADRSLSRRWDVLLAATALQAVILMCDAATVWALLRSLGTRAPLLGVSASFITSSLFRMVNLLPGGLGSFEVASVVTLKMTGASLAAALSATMLFRVLSFWLPMIPGFLFSRGAVGRAEGD